MKKIFIISNLALFLSLSAYSNNAHFMHENMNHNASSNQTLKNEDSTSLNSANALDERDKLMLKNAQMLDAMHMPMMHTKFAKSGSIERDFLENMLPHHQGAVDSSKIFLRFSQNERLKKIAANIIKNQSAEISEFNVLLTSNDIKSTSLNANAYENFVKKEQDLSEKMMRSMKENTDIAQSFDENYIKAMLAHHQGAIELSKQILELSKDKKVRKIASNIIKAQEKEVKEFNALLKKN